ncbi:hypothetical protein SSUR61_0710 [Streptococcus suis R61]|uniref:Uncharacterized protein n=1 Tax=Streptococcus suis R61 TaxID=996306 RepID=A0AA87F906_STRSU|nr:hypothetical protein SSUR61_0710 [Streptococcus suis R61]
MSPREATNRKEKVQVRVRFDFYIRTCPKDCVKKINIDLTPIASAPNFLFSLCPFNGLCIIDYVKKTFDFRRWHYF